MSLDVQECSTRLEEANQISMRRGPSTLLPVDIFGLFCTTLFALSQPSALLYRDSCLCGTPGASSHCCPVTSSYTRAPPPLVSLLPIFNHKQSIVFLYEVFYSYLCLGHSRCRCHCHLKSRALLPEEKTPAAAHWVLRKASNTSSATAIPQPSNI